MTGTKELAWKTESADILKTGKNQAILGFSGSPLVPEYWFSILTSQRLTRNQSVQFLRTSEFEAARRFDTRVKICWSDQPTFLQKRPKIGIFRETLVLGCDI